MDPRSDEAWFSASNPGLGVTIEYRWKRSDFPWLGIWEENRSRSRAPWNSRTITRGMEFGVSPVPESRRHMMGAWRALRRAHLLRWLLLVKLR